MYIINSVDNWAYYQDYLLAALKFQKPEECLNFLNKIITTLVKKCRAPYLAKFELLKLTQNGEIIENVTEPIDLMYQYFSQFGEKSCVVGDLRLYLHLLTPMGKQQLIQKVSNKIANCIIHIKVTIHLYDILFRILLCF